MKVPEYNTINPNHAREKYIRKTYPEFHQYLLDNYPDELSFSERMYWYYKGLTDWPKCKGCGNRTKYRNLTVGYSEFCCSKCSNSSPDKIAHIKQTNNERYGGNAPAASDEVKAKSKRTNLERHGSETYNNREAAKRTMIARYGGVGNASEQIRKKQYDTMMAIYGETNSLRVKSVKDKMRENNRKKYGVEWVFQRDDIKQKSRQTCMARYGVAHYTNPEQGFETQKRNNLKKYGVPYSFLRDDVRQKSIQTCIELYGTENYNNYEQNKNTCQEKYGVENHMQIPGVMDKIMETKKLNNSFNTSSIEEQFTMYLTECGIEFERQYKSELYPYHCDFYIPEYDLYIEIQGNWTHGGHPFTGSEEDLVIINAWKSKNTPYYMNAVRVWTVADVEKRNTAKENKLNYLEIFSTNINEVVNEYERTIEQF